MAATRDDQWPALPYGDWKETYATLHMWMQMAGKVAVAQAPRLNHSWGVAFHMTPRGVSTQLLPHGSRVFAIEFDFIDHQLIVRISDGTVGRLALAPQSVAAFYRAFTQLLEDLGLTVTIWSMPVEIPTPIRFEEDTDHHHYDPVWANRAWRVCVSTWRVLSETRAGFVGKSSPVHFFWGSFDMAFTRFSGRPAPPREGPAFMVEAYSHEVISHGFWPGGGPLLEPVFYGYAAPEPAGFKEARVDPDEAYYQKDFGEYVLPYEAMRTSRDPEATLRAFVDTTYVQAATLANWDRTALERGSQA